MLPFLFLGLGGAFFGFVKGEFASNVLYTVCFYIDGKASETVEDYREQESALTRMN